MRRPEGQQMRSCSLWTHQLLDGSSFQALLSSSPRQRRPRIQRQRRTALYCQVLATERRRARSRVSASSQPATSFISAHQELPSIFTTPLSHLAPLHLAYSPFQFLVDQQAKEGDQSVSPASTERGAIPTPLAHSVAQRTPGTVPSPSHRRRDPIL